MRVASPCRSTSTTGATHGFFNDSGQGHHAEASADSWEKTLAFLKANVPA